MQIFTTDVVMDGLRGSFEGVKLFKDAIVEATFSNIGIAIKQLLAGELISLLAVVAGMLLVIRIMPWVVGYLSRS